MLKFISNQYFFFLCFILPLWNCGRTQGPDNDIADYWVQLSTRTSKKKATAKKENKKTAIQLHTEYKWRYLTKMKKSEIKRKQKCAHSLMKRAQRQCWVLSFGELISFFCKLKPEMKLTHVRVFGIDKTAPI